MTFKVGQIPNQRYVRVVVVPSVERCQARYADPGVVIFEGRRVQDSQISDHNCEVAVVSWCCLLVDGFAADKKLAA